MNELLRTNFIFHLRNIVVVGGDGGDFIVSGRRRRDPTETRAARGVDSALFFKYFVNLFILIYFLIYFFFFEKE